MRPRVRRRREEYAERHQQDRQREDDADNRRDSSDTGCFAARTQGRLFAVRG
jgi:hypothetical protein